MYFLTAMAEVVDLTVSDPEEVHSDNSETVVKEEVLLA